MDDTAGIIEIKTIVLGIAKTTEDLKLQMAAFDAKLDENAVRIAQYGERLSNHKRLIDKLEEEAKIRDNNLYNKIRETKRETVAEAITKIKNWVLISIVSGLVAIMLSIVTHFIKQ